MARLHSPTVLVGLAVSFECSPLAPRADYGPRSDPSTFHYPVGSRLTLRKQTFTLPDYERCGRKKARRVLPPLLQPPCAETSRELKRAIISDIHGNMEALQAVLADARGQGVEETFCLGDIIGYGPNPCECLDQVIESTRICLL